MDNYISVIKSAIGFFPLIAFIFSTPFVLYNYHKYGSISVIKSIIIYSFIFYLLCAYFLVILPLPKVEEVISLTSPRMQLIPFSFIYDFFKYINFSSIKSIFLSSVFFVPLYNVLLTIPFGIYIKYYFKTSLSKTMLYSFLLSLFFELTQLTGIYFIYPRGYRLFDVDDLILNTFGGVLGYYISGPFLKHVPSTLQVNNDSIKKGIKIVSGFRKLTAFIMDMFILIVLSLLIYIFINNIKKAFFYSLIIYYFVFPIFTLGRTIGEMFLNMKVVSIDNNVNILRTFFRRIIFLLMYLVLPFFICYSLIYLGDFPFVLKLVLSLIIFGGLFFYYVLSIFKFLFSKKYMLYERISYTKYISTIKGDNL